MNETLTKEKSGSSRREGRPPARRQRTSRSSARVVDAAELANDPRIMARAARELAALAGTKNRKADLSDAPELPPAAWKDAVHGVDAWLKTVRAQSFYRPVKQAVSMRLDADVVSWLKQLGPGYQTRANQILREKMLAEVSQAPRG